MSETDRRDYRSIGEILSDAREERGWSVEEVSERTKIAPRQIHALEADDLATLSGPVYARGFVRNLCNLYDLDREWVMLKLDAALESGEPTPENSPVDLQKGAMAAPTPELPREEPAEAEQEEDDAPTWTIETVDNARVHRVRSESRHVPWLKIVVGGAVLVALALLVWFVMARPSSPESGGPTAVLESSPRDAETNPVQVAQEPSEEDRSEVAAMEADSPEASSRAQDDTASEGTPSPPGSGDEVAGATSSASAGTEVGQEERVLYDDRGDEGLSSVLRQATEDLDAFELKLTAIGPVTARVSSDGRQAKTRRMRAGQSWILEARDHFTLQLSDVNNVIAEIDGVRRLPPRGDFPEWILYRTIASAEGH